MARASDVQPGSVWTDSRGHQFEVLGAIEADGKFSVRNLATNRTSRKGPRALVSPSGNGGGVGYDYPAQQSAPSPAPPRRAPPPRRAAPPPPPRPQARQPTQPPFPVFEQPGYDQSPYQPTPGAFAPSSFPVSMPPGAYPSPMGYPSSFPPPSQTRQPPSRQPLGFPSELTLYVARRLAAMRPDHASNVGIVGQEVARALAAWNQGRR